MKQEGDFKIINYAICHLNKMENFANRKLFFNARKEARNFVKRMKKVGYDYSYEGEEMEKEILTKKFKKDYLNGLRNAKAGYFSGVKRYISALRKDAKELNLNVSEKVKKLENICLERNVENIWEEIGMSLLQEKIDFSEITYIENTFPLLEKKVEKLEPEKRDFFKKQFPWAKKIFYEKAMITCYEKSLGKKDSIYHLMTKQYAEEIGIIL
jgi:hypothetical protein